MSYSVRLLLPAILLFTAKGLFAQAIVNKGDVIIHIHDSDAGGNYKFFIDIYKKGNSAKIVYAYNDSLKFSEVRKDTDYGRVHKHLQSYDYNDPRREAIWDTIGRIFERHRVYTRDSINLKLKADTAYKNLLSLIAKAGKAELQQNKKRSVLDGDFPAFTIVTHSETKTIAAHSPTMEEMPLLYKLLVYSLDQAKESSAVKKIRGSFGYSDTH